MDNNNTDTKFLNRNMLKISAVIAMTIDHIAQKSFVINPTIVVLRFIGRLTAPVMVYLLADSFRYTHNLEKFMKRMLIFSLISIFTFSFLETGYFSPVKIFNGSYVDYPYNFIYLQKTNRTLCFCNLNMLFNLYLSLLNLKIWEKTKIKAGWKILLTILLLCISMFCDWKYIPIVLSLVFYYCKDRKVGKWILYSLVSFLYIFNILIPGNSLDLSQYIDVSFKTYRIGMMLAPIVIIFFYNGKSGKKNAFSKWFFYIYYPLHQLIIGLF